MASERHNFIVSVIARKMRSSGFEIIYLDGKPQDIGTKRFNIPPRIINHRPDIVGEKDGIFFCIGEAKTQNDIHSERTKNQIIDFLALVRQNSGNKLILGIPLDAKDDLEKLLVKLGVVNLEQLDFVYIPELLLPYEENL